MAGNSSLGTILTWGAIGLGAWYIYENYFAGSAAASGAPGGSTGGSTTGTGTSSSGTSTNTGSGSSTPAYSGPSLAAIFAMFQAAVAANYTPPELAATPRPPGPQRTGNSPALLVVGQRPTGLRGLGDASITQSGGVFYANPDVFNYYLAQVLPSPNVTSPYGWPPDVTEVFPGFDRTQPMSITDYWSGMSGYLSSRMGLSGLGCFGWNEGHNGVGMYDTASYGWPEIPTQWWGAGRPVQ